MSDKNFLLGVGTQKTGTSWLYQYLKHHPQCDFGFRKEYHIFDALFVEHCQNLMIGNLRAQSRCIEKKIQLISKPTPMLDKKLLLNARILSFRLDPTQYADYFHKLHAASPHVRLVGDITPSYCALKREHFSYIRTLLEDAGFCVKVIFCMRDPVERIFSAARMKKRIASSRGEGISEDFDEIILREYQSPGMVDRTRYEKTITELEAAFGGESLYYCFYENYLCEEGMIQLTEFLEIPYEPADFKKYNPSTPAKPLSAETVSMIRKYYDETYRFCRQRFGEALINNLWRHA